MIAVGAMMANRPKMAVGETEREEAELFLPDIESLHIHCGRLRNFWRRWGEWC